MTNLPFKEHAPARGHISPSQIEAFELCQRKWGWRVLDKIDVPPNSYALFGLRVHSQLEAYLKDGTPFDQTTAAGECAAVGREFLPVPNTPLMEIEASWYMEGWGHLFHGKTDVRIDRLVENALDPWHAHRVPIIFDHKTTGNFAWAHTPETLVSNVQAVLYAAHAMTRFNSPVVDLRWLYFRRTKPYRARPVDRRVHQEEIVPVLERIRDVADEMRLIKLSGRKTKDLPANASACSAYGGCPYVRHCNLTSREKLAGVMRTMDDPKSAFLDRVQKQVAAQGGHGVQNNAIPPTAATSVWVPPAPAVNEDVLRRARAGHPNWQPGEPWWTGQAYVPFGHHLYPPVFLYEPPPDQVAPVAHVVSVVSTASMVPVAPVPLEAPVALPAPVAPAAPVAPLPQVAPAAPVAPPPQVAPAAPVAPLPQVAPAAPVAPLAPVAPPPSAAPTVLVSEPVPGAVAMPEPVTEAPRRGRPAGSRSKKVDVGDPNADPLLVAMEGLELISTGALLLRSVLPKLFNSQTPSAT